MSMDENQKSECAFSRNFYENSSKRSPVQVYCIPVGNIASRCSRCNEITSQTLNLEISGNGFVPCNCENHVGSQDQAELKSSALSSCTKLKRAHRAKELQAANQQMNLFDYPEKIFTLLRNSEEHCKELKGSTILKIKKLSDNSTRRSTVIDRKIKKTHRRSSKLAETAVAREVDSSREAFYNKYNPFERLRRTYQENIVIVSSSQSFDWQLFSHIYFKSKNEQLNNLHKNLLGGCQNIWGDIDRLTQGTPKFNIDLDSLNTLSQKYPQIESHIGLHQTLFFALVERSQSVGDNNGGKEADLESDESFRTSKADLSNSKVPERNAGVGKKEIDLIGFLKEVSLCNRESITNILENVKGKFKEATSNERILKQDEKTISKYSNFLNYVKFVKQFKIFFSKYLKIKEDLSDYLSYVEKYKANWSKINIKPRENPQSIENESNLQNQLKPTNTRILSNQTGCFNFKSGDLYDQSVSSPHGFGSMICRDISESQLLKTTKHNSNGSFESVIFTSKSIKHTVKASSDKNMSSSAIQNEPNLSKRAPKRQPSRLKSTNCKKNTKLKTESTQEKHPDYEIESDCAICFSSDTSYTYPVIYCSKCLVGVHLACVNFREIPSENYYCLSCEQKDGDDQAPSCYICNQKGFMLLKVAGAKDLVYHMFCAFATKSWNEVYDYQISSKPKFRCQAKCVYCNKQSLANTKMLKCVGGCNKRSFHTLCAFFNGLYFLIKSDSELTYAHFNSKQFDYSADFFCEACTFEKLNKVLSPISGERELTEMVSMNAYFRLICLWPRFCKKVPTFEHYKFLRSRDIKFWTQM
jgi:hypothetical protein